ncbi:MAG: DUF4164 family protein [Pseudomonadota bacterium]
MTDSADMDSRSGTDVAAAARALSAALDGLDAALGPVLAKTARLETRMREADAMTEDRGRLAAQLDEALEARRLREAEFEDLSRQTREEIDLTIQALKQAMSSQATSTQATSTQGGAGQGSSSHG